MASHHQSPLYYFHPLGSYSSRDPPRPPAQTKRWAEGIRVPGPLAGGGSTTARGMFLSSSHDCSLSEPCLSLTHCPAGPFRVTSVRAGNTLLHNCLCPCPGHPQDSSGQGWNLPGPLGSLGPGDVGVAFEWKPEQSASSTHTCPQPAAQQRGPGGEARSPPVPE